MLGQDRAFGRTEVRLSVTGEDLGDGGALAPLHEIVDVEQLPIEPVRERAADARLARSHEADEIDFVRPHATRLSSVAKKPG